MGFESVVVHSRNARTEVPIACAIHMRKLYENINFPVQRSQYDEDSCRLCTVVKETALIVRLQVGDITMLFYP
jgi:hypothetical protein